MHVYNNIPQYLFVCWVQIFFVCIKYSHYYAYKNLNEGKSPIMSRMGMMNEKRLSWIAFKKIISYLKCKTEWRSIIAQLIIGTWQSVHNTTSQHWAESVTCALPILCYWLHTDLFLIIASNLHPSNEGCTFGGERMRKSLSTCLFWRITRVQTKNEEVMVCHVMGTN